MCRCPQPLWCYMFAHLQIYLLSCLLCLFFGFLAPPRKLGSPSEFRTVRLMLLLSHDIPKVMIDPNSAGSLLHVCCMWRSLQLHFPHTRSSQQCWQRHVHGTRPATFSDPWTGFMGGCFLLSCHNQIGRPLTDQHSIQECIREHSQRFWMWRVCSTPVAGWKISGSPLLGATAAHGN